MPAHHVDDDAASIASSSSASSDATSARERPHSPTSLFEDSLFTLFSHNQPAHGDPGDTCRYTHAHLAPRYLSASRARPTTLRYKIAQNSGTNTKLFAHHQWDAGLYLADLIAEQSFSSNSEGKQRERRAFVDVRGRDVVELGAGTGLPGLVACAMGAQRTVITDYPDAHVMDNLERNLDLALLPRSSSSSKRSERRPNPHYLEARKRVQVMGLGWGNADEEARVLAASAADAGYDVVLAADVLWVSSAHPLLIHSIRKLLKRDRNARCVLIAGFHTGRPAVRRFFVQLAQPADSNDTSLDRERKAGIVPDWQDTEFGGICERNVDGSQRAWSGAPVPSKADYDKGKLTSFESEEGAMEEMGDISDRGSWVVVASLRWADLE
ncbi:hypothetical protein EX895_003832 [Sporisorium graminicola]|uniref:Nicotinamide N-methyltransferase n=1 Tax=Sporisorium graminicola TaxID=280036 RepID=A0A4U7KRI2_9BASI|nr:hypothetical protein EX895_003832 [Sporisorium graminicola]TKY87155.1 hypothetical protein EX895_003832 [Sporisorium graminicola]